MALKGNILYISAPGCLRIKTCRVRLGLRFRLRCVVVMVKGAQHQSAMRGKQLGNVFCDCGGALSNLRKSFKDIV